MLSTIGSLISHAASLSPVVVVVGIAAIVLVSVIRAVLAFVLLNKALDKLGSADDTNRAAIIDALTTTWGKRRKKQ